MKLFYLVFILYMFWDVYVPDVTGEAQIIKV